MFYCVEDAQQDLPLEYRNPKGNREIIRRDLILFFILKKLRYTLFPPAIN
jgi:hypothetical protein